MNDSTIHKLAFSLIFIFFFILCFIMFVIMFNVIEHNKQNKSVAITEYKQFSYEEFDDVRKLTLFKKSNLNTPIIEIIAAFSVKVYDNQLKVTCKIGPDKYIVHLIDFQPRSTFKIDVFNPKEKISKFHHEVKVY